ncbi:MAG: CoA transferase [Dehalococcoidia bacterium]|nr:CoA transferase [Dehalococcoidia bacterium]
MAGALHGIRVIDFGQYLAGPLAAQLLCDQGAEVVRVDPPGGPRWQTPANAAFNRGKQSIVLDLAEAGGRETARALVASADVVIENFRPGVMDRLGLGAAAMTEANPRLVYCSLPGFASDDPRAGTAAWEGVVGAASGLYRRNRIAAEAGAPVYTALPLASSYAAIQGAVAVGMALTARERDGLGQRIEVPLFDAMYGAVGYNGYSASAVADRPLGAAMSLTTQWECADGNWIMFHTGNSRTEDVLAAAGVAHWIERGYTDRVRLATDRDLAAEVTEAARALFKTRPAAEWEALVNDAGGECSVCRPASEWIEHPHALGSGAIVEVDDPVFGRVKQPGIPARLSRTPGAVQGPARALDADREAILRALGTAAARPVVAGSAPEATMRAALDGVRVLDLCIVLAGPTCGRTLAEYGADVVKIEAPDRPPMGAFHGDVNRGKRSIVLDLKTPEGLEAFWALVDGADVVVQNFRKGVAERLGVGYEQVRARKPDIVYASLNCYGHDGPLADRAGHEQIAQAVTGMQDRYRTEDGMPQTQRYAVNDYGTGYLGAYGVSLALLHRARTGEGQFVDAALCYTATFLQSPFLVGTPGKTWDEARGQEQVGSSPLHRAYQASDAWLFLGARNAAELAAVEGLEAVATQEGESLAKALEERLAQGTAAEWVARLTAAGVGAHHVVNSTDDLMTLDYAREQGLSVTREHPHWGAVTSTGPAPRLSRTPVRPGDPAPVLGAHSREVLREAGLGDRVEALIASGGVLEAQAGGVPG